MRAFLHRLRQWLNGEYRCTRCGKTWHGFFFGTGLIICPRCYKGEQPWRWPRSVLTGRSKPKEAFR